MSHATKHILVVGRYKELGYKYVFTLASVFQPGSPGIDSSSDSVSRSALYQSRGEEPYVAAAPRPVTPPVAPTATLIDIEEPPPAQPEPEPEQLPTPDEPTPDYSLKSVGFKETVICVSPPMEPHEEEEDEDEDEEEAEDEREKNEEGAGETAETGRDTSEHEPGQEDKGKTSDGESDNGENSIL